MGGGAYAKDIEKYKKQMGFRIISVGLDDNTPISRLADKFYNIDTQDIDHIVHIVKKKM